MAGQQHSDKCRYNAKMELEQPCPMVVKSSSKKPERSIFVQGTQAVSVVFVAVLRFIAGEISHASASF